MFIKKHIKEIFLSLAWISGWGLVTWALSDLFGKWIVKVSGGLLLLGLVGYRFIFKIFTEGIYTLLIEEKEDDIKG